MHQWLDNYLTIQNVVLNLPPVLTVQTGTPLETIPTRDTRLHRTAFEFMYWRVVASLFLGGYLYVFIVSLIIHSQQDDKPNITLFHWAEYFFVNRQNCCISFIPQSKCVLVCSVTTRWVTNKWLRHLFSSCDILTLLDILQSTGAKLYVHEGKV